MIDPKALLTFLNDHNNFRMACCALTDIGEDGVVLFISAIVKLVLKCSQYMPFQVIRYAHNEMGDHPLLPCPSDCHVVIVMWLTHLECLCVPHQYDRTDKVCF